MHKTLTVFVTQPIIDQARLNSHTPGYTPVTGCAVALAVNEALASDGIPPVEWAITSGYDDTYYQSVKSVVVSNSDDRDKVTKFVYDFDYERPVTPMSFSIMVMEY